MSYRNDRFQDSFVSLDAIADSIDLAKARIVSDNGAGARRIRGEDTELELEELEINKIQKQKLRDAITKLTNAGKKHLIPVLIQIVKNGKDRKESIAQIALKRNLKFSSAERHYDRGVNALLEIFTPK